MIKSFGDRATEDLYHGWPSARSRRLPRRIVATALIKLDMIENAEALLDLAAPPGNRLEALRGTMNGFYSIRVNEQWRLVFRWRSGHAHEVRLTDYHR